MPIIIGNKWGLSMAINRYWMFSQGPSFISDSPELHCDSGMPVGAVNHIVHVMRLYATIIAVSVRWRPKYIMYKQKPFRRRWPSIGEDQRWLLLEVGHALTLAV